LAVGFGLACCGVLLIMGVVAWWRDMRDAGRAWRRAVAELKGAPFWSCVAVVAVTVTGWPSWQYSRMDRQLHLGWSLVDGVVELLCVHYARVAELEEPTGEDQPRCAGCVRAFGELCGAGDLR
jgi:hypothetical protein